MPCDQLSLLHQGLHDGFWESEGRRTKQEGTGNRRRPDVRMYTNPSVPYTLDKAPANDTTYRPFLAENERSKRRQNDRAKTGTKRDNRADDGVHTSDDSSMPQNKASVPVGINTNQTLNAANSSRVTELRRREVQRAATKYFSTLACRPFLTHPYLPCECCVPLGPHPISSKHHPRRSLPETHRCRFLDARYQTRDTSAKHPKNNADLGYIFCR